MAPFSCALLLLVFSGLGAADSPPQELQNSAIALALEEEAEDRSCALQALQVRAGQLLALHAAEVEEVLQEVHGEEPPKEASVEECRHTRMTLRYHSRPGLFDLPKAGLGNLTTRPCEFEGRAYPHGEVTFECRKDRWHYSRDTCAVCPPVPAAGFPRAVEAGRHWYTNCSGLPGFTHGQITYSCQDNGTWIREADDCSACRATNFNFTLGGDSGLFLLPPALAVGEETKLACDFDNVRYPKGHVTFACRAGRWKYVGESCAACAATNISVQIGEEEGIFELPRWPKLGGGSFWQPCVFSNHTHGYGTVNFRCEDSQWVFSNHTCDQCPNAGPFNVTCCDNTTGSVVLPSSSREGQIVRAPCTSSSPSGNASTGGHSFICEGGRWRFQKALCSDSWHEA